MRRGYWDERAPGPPAGHWDDQRYKDKGPPYPLPYPSPHHAPIPHPSQIPPGHHVPLHLPHPPHPSQAPRPPPQNLPAISNHGYAPPIITHHLPHPPHPRDQPRDQTTREKKREIRTEDPRRERAGATTEEDLRQPRSYDPPPPPYFQEKRISSDHIDPYPPPPSSNGSQPSPHPPTVYKPNFLRLSQSDRSQSADLRGDYSHDPPRDERREIRTEDPRRDDLRREDPRREDLGRSHSDLGSSQRRGEERREDQGRRDDLGSSQRRGDERRDDLRRDDLGSSQRRGEERRDDLGSSQRKGEERRDDLRREDSRREDPGRSHSDLGSSQRRGGDDRREDSRRDDLSRSLRHSSGGSRHYPPDEEMRGVDLDKDSNSAILELNVAKLAFKGMNIPKKLEEFVDNLNSYWDGYTHARDETLNLRKDRMRVDKQEDMYMFDLTKAEWKLEQAERRLGVVLADLEECEKQIESLREDKVFPESTWAMKSTPTQAANTGPTPMQLG